MMDTEEIFETLVFSSTLTRLIAREHLSIFICCGNFRAYTDIHTYEFYTRKSTARGSSVGIATRLWARWSRNWYSIPGRNTRFFSSQSQSQSHIATDDQSISKSWCRSPSGAHDQILITVWQLLSCPWEGALSDERTGLSSASSIRSVVSMYNFYILHVSHVIEYIYNIYKASVSPGSVQQIMPYFW
jgi:hypothetical protein